MFQNISANAVIEVEADCIVWYDEDMLNTADVHCSWFITHCIQDSLMPIFSTIVISYFMKCHVCVYIECQYIDIFDLIYLIYCLHEN